MKKTCWTAYVKMLVLGGFLCLIKRVDESKLKWYKCRVLVDQDAQGVPVYVEFADRDGFYWWFFDMI
ncbi:MAG: hypothetical protein JXR80_00640 [Deltaproteobacteria bacterium]|nr:hypothetical protein [Deltaproteobacteria bacterium]